METIKKNDTGAAVADVQHKLSSLGFLDEGACSGRFDDATVVALHAFCRSKEIPETDQVDEKTWNALVDASFSLGDRSLYLRMPFFHGNDVAQLQQALSSLGFECGLIDGIFGAHTELALRKFQTNMGLPSDGIVGAFTYATLKNLEFSWAGKPVTHNTNYLGFSRAYDVLEERPLCLFGTDDFTRSVAARMSNLALATNPASRVASADALMTGPGDNMLLVHVALPGDSALKSNPTVTYDQEETLALRLRTAIDAAERSARPARITILLPDSTWEGAGRERSAQHFAITLLDALCVALLPE